MPTNKRMGRKEDGALDEASEALLDAMHVEGNSRRASAEQQSDDPFCDADGDMHVTPTFEDLSNLVDDASTQSLPMVEILRRNLRVTLRATEMAELAYHACPKQGQATALTQMQNLTKDLIKSIEERQDPDILRAEIMEVVIVPLVTEFVKVLTSEADRKRSALLAIVPPESAGVVQHEMKDLLTGVAQGCDEAMDGSSRKLDKLLGSRINKGRK